MAPHPKDIRGGDDSSSSPSLTGLAQGSFFTDEEETEVEIGSPSEEEERRRERRHRQKQQQQQRRNDRAVSYTNDKAVGKSGKNGMVHNSTSTGSSSSNKNKESDRCSWCRSRRLTALVIGFATLLAILYGIVLFLNSKGIRLMRRNSSGDFATLVSLSAVATHDNPDDCWLSIAGHVYDLTDYTHPGGNSYIYGRCGREATTAFEKEHSRHYLPMIEAFARGKLVQEELESASVGDGTTLGDAPTASVIQAVPVEGPVPVPVPVPYPVPFPVEAIAPQQVVAPFPAPFPAPFVAPFPVPFVAPVAPPPVAAPVAPPVAAPFCINPAEVLLHSTPDDCFYILYGDVFDFTYYVDEHPGGPEYIEDECGTDATAMYETAKKHDFSLLQRKGGYNFYIGPACAST